MLILKGCVKVRVSNVTRSNDEKCHQMCDILYVLCRNDENFSKKAFTRILTLEKVLSETAEMTEAEKDSVYLFEKCLKMDDEKRKIVVQFAKAICTNGT